MTTALLQGTNITRDGSIRQWDCVEYEGQYRDNDNGETLLNILENNKRRVINLNTFSGTILDNDYEFNFVKGQLVSKNAYNLPF